MGKMGTERSRVSIEKALLSFVSSDSSNLYTTQQLLLSKFLFFYPYKCPSLMDNDLGDDSSEISPSHACL